MKLTHFAKLFSIALLSLGFVACDDSDDDDKIDITIQASSTDAIADFSDFSVKISSQRSGNQQVANLDKDGKATFHVDLGSYAIVVAGSVDGKGYTGSTDIEQYASSKTVSIPVAHLGKAYLGQKDGLVLKEIFYNGGTYGGTMMHPDQYIVIANNSDHDIYVDSLVISQSSNMNTLPCAALTDLLPDYVSVANMYMIPGDGKTYLLKSGEVYVIASSAIDHSANYDYNADKDTGIPVNLSGADFELADEDASQKGTVTDNPKVPNLIKLSNSMPNGVTAWMHPYGIRPLFIFDGSGINWDSFKSANALTYKDKANVNSEISEFQGYKIPTSLIVDGVETTSATTPYWGNFEKKSLPRVVDDGYAYATQSNDSGFSCHHSIFMYRVEAADGFLQDTNNSSNDMKIEHRQDFKGYPEGWRTSGSN